MPLFPFDGDEVMSVLVPNIDVISVAQSNMSSISISPASLPRPFMDTLLCITRHSITPRKNLD